MFSGVEKGCIENEWVKMYLKHGFPLLTRKLEKISCCTYKRHFGIFRTFNEPS